MDLSVAILAAGQSKRFRSQTSKVLHRLCGKPLLFYPLTAARALNPRNIYIIVGPNGQDIQERFQAEDVEFVLQPEPRGTGDAVRQLESRLDAAGTLVVLPGDAPLIRPETLQQLVRTHLQNQGIATVLTS
ncbi:MAG: NTP transferase domain-containing protein, partial [Candidatus Hydrothermae bacterium]|nr:NTP transferase domain-containing protein [Candidatus Hydrothermae bacterium]